MITQIVLPVFIASNFSFVATTSTGGIAVANKRTNEVFFVRKRYANKFLRQMLNQEGDSDYIAEIQQFTGRKGKEVQNVLIPAPNFYITK